MQSDPVSFKSDNHHPGAPEKKPLPWWESFFRLKNPVTYIPLILALIILFWGASLEFHKSILDTHIYACYSLVFWLGQHGYDQAAQFQQCHYLATLAAPSSSIQPFHILPVEYPPLTLLVFSPALILPLSYYSYTFALGMALVATLIYLALLRYGPRGSSLVFVTLLSIAAFSTAEARYDLVPAFFTLLCVIAASRKRWTLAYIALALGVLLKIYPIILLPALFIAEQRDVQRFHMPPSHLPLSRYPKEIWLTLHSLLHWRWKNTLICVALIIGVTGCFALLNFHEAVVSQLSYFAKRPIQIESTGSTLLWLGRKLGYPAAVAYGFGSVNFSSGLTGVVSLLFEGLLVISYALTVLWQWRGKLNLTHAFIMLTLVFIVMGKVFSPQYLIWIIPLLAYSGAFNRLWLLLWGLICGLTTYIFPFMYLRAGDPHLLPQTHYFLEAVALRNLCLFLATVAFLFNWFNFTWPAQKKLAATTPGGSYNNENEDTLPLPVVSSQREGNMLTH